MSFKIRRGLNSERLAIIPLEGEIVYATDTKLVYVGDGATYGGVPVNISANVFQQTLVGGNINYILSSTILDANRIFVIVNGLIQLPTIDYTVNGANLTFTSNTIQNSTIDVRIVQ
jgi:hypothetical protein